MTVTATLISALLLGASGGLSPGPLLMLLVSETLRYGLRAGIKVSLAPLVSDVPIVAVCFLLLSQFADVDPVMGGLSLAGAALLAYLGWGNLRHRGLPDELPASDEKSLRKAVTINFLNPNPYLFWLLIGTPTVLAANRRSFGEALVFVVVFYTLLVGSKVLMAVLVHRSRALLLGRAYAWIVRGLGALLLAYAATFAYEGLRLLSRGA